MYSRGFLSRDASTWSSRDAQVAAIGLARELVQGYAFQTTGKYEEKDIRGDGHTSYVSEPVCQEDRFQDVFMDDLLEDPCAVLHELYRGWGLEMSAEHVRRVQAWHTSEDKRLPISYAGDHMGTILPLVGSLAPYFQRFPKASPKNLYFADFGN